MNSEALYEHADYLEKGEFGDRGFDMGNIDECVLGHMAWREMKRTSKPVAFDTLGGLAKRLFDIEEIEDFAFAFGGWWGTDPKAAAYRLRDLARNKKAPPRELWDQYRQAPAPSTLNSQPSTIPQELAAV